MEKPKKEIDAVQLVRRIRDAHYEALKSASREDRIAFYNSTVEQRRSAPDPARKPAP